MKKIQFLLLSLLLTLPVTAMAQNSIKGDVNGDGTVNITDLNAVINMIIDDSATMIADVNGDGTVNIADINAIISIIIDGPAEEEEDEYVDLGLPSGTLWATRNVGASRPEDYGDYFAWGETAPKEIYNYDNYKWPDFSKYNEIDSLTELEPEDDAAYVNWGPTWRMPTDEQYNELFSSCSWQWAQQDGVNGMLLTSPNGNTLFLPAAGERWFDDLVSDGSLGHYWTRTRYAHGSFAVSGAVLSVLLEFVADDWHTGWRPVRQSGRSVRAVRISPIDPPSLYIEQQSLDLGNVLVEETRTGRLTIANNTTEPMTLTATVDEPFSFMQPEGGVSSMTITVPGHSRDTVTVMFTATKLGDFNGNVTFQCPALEGGQSVIPVHALAFNPLEEFVDLGLPSGTLWATCNVGAVKPEDYGDYFAWGETTPKDVYSWSTYKWCNGSSNKLTKYCTDSVFGTVDGLMELEPADDAAHVNWGKLWRMPTLEQQQELISECTWEWKTSKGVNGYQVTGPNGNTMFLPAAGYRNNNDSLPFFLGSYGDYWSRTLNASYPDYARDQYFYSSGAHWGISSRFMGFTLRAVRAEPDVYIRPRSLDLGEVPVGETREGELTIVNNTTQSVILTATVDEPFSFKQEEGNTSTMTLVVPVGSCKLSVMFTATAPVTHAQGRVIFKGSALEGGKCVIPVQVAVIYTSDYVDLGLPSGTLWATRNIGANSPEEYGDYFAWGETAPKEVYTVQTYKWGGYDSDGQFYLSKYNSISGYGTIDNKNELDPEDDAAYVNWGAAWRMPSDEQIKELISNCTWKWTQSNGVNGKLFTGPNDNTLFLPAAGIYYSGDNSFRNEGSIGEYWSRMLNPSDDVNARALGLSEKDIHYGGSLRAHGFTVRAVLASHN